MNKVLALVFGFTVVLILTIYYFNAPIQSYILSLLSSDTQTPVKVINTDLSEDSVEIIASGLDVPWEIAFLPNKDMLVSLRKGELLLYRDSKEISRFNIDGVNSEGEGGLLGIAVHPNFQENNFIYLYLTTKENNRFENRVNRYRVTSNELEFDRTILSDIRGNIYHNAGKIAFGSVDNYLYITAGDALEESLAQDSSVLAGKILRVTDEGETPSDNPFQNEIYSLGHRNPQGLTWDSNGNLWSTEHGQSGLSSGQDELNKIIKGKNYGWPYYRGDLESPNYESPIIHSGNNTTWAPGDAEYYAGIIFFTGLRGAGIYKYSIDNKQLTKYFDNEFGRLRAITLGPDGYFYVSTSNRDGRGTPNEGDDKILRINPKLFFE